MREMAGEVGDRRVGKGVRLWEGPRVRGCVYGADGAGDGGEVRAQVVKSMRSEVCVARVLARAA